MTSTLRERVTQISIGAFLAASAVALAGFILFSLSKRNLSQSEVERDLKNSAVAQVEQLIPSFLLPEQLAGIETQLRRFKEREALTHAETFTQKSQLPAAFAHCMLNSKSSTTCLSVDAKETAIILPITEGSRHFGFLLKAKVNSSSWAMQDILQLVGIFALMLILTFATVYAFIARILSRRVPEELDRLVQWIDDDLGDRRSQIASLPFREFEDLKDKISEVMDRHSQARDQAIIGQVTSGIMHDIRTPLQSLVTARSLLDRAPESSDKRTRYLENLALMCSENLPVIQSIVETTLDGSRNIALSLTKSDLAKTVQKSVELNEQCAKLHHVDLDLQCPIELPLLHDSSQLLRVTHNLVKNAIEAASESQTSKKVHVAIAELSQNEIEITVEDTGPGITGSPDRIFRAFKSSKIRGSGLGLMITKKIVEAHGGTISAGKSTLLGGAHFRVILPRLDSLSLQGATV